MTLLYNFGDLTPEQRDVIARGGWAWTPGVSRSEPADDIVDPLVARGLLVVHHSRTRSVLEGGERRGSVRRSFTVPSRVSAAWRAFRDAEFTMLGLP